MQWRRQCTCSVQPSVKWARWTLQLLRQSVYTCSVTQYNLVLALYTGEACFGRLNFNSSLLCVKYIAFCNLVFTQEIQISKHQSIWVIYWLLCLSLLMSFHWTDRNNKLWILHVCERQQHILWIGFCVFHYHYVCYLLLFFWLLSLFVTVIVCYCYCLLLLM